MLKITIANVEEKLLFNGRVLNVLYNDFSDLIDRWKKAQYSNVASVSRNIAMLLLNSLKERHVILVEEIIGEKVVVEKIENNLIKNDIISINDAQEYLHAFSRYNLSLYRDADNLHITYWR